MTYLGLKRAILAGTVLILGLVVGGAMLVMHNRHEQAVSASSATLSASARAIESIVNRQLLQIDSALASIPTLFGSIAGRGALEAPEAQQLLQGLNFQAFAFRNIMLVQPDGRIWATARPYASSHGGPLDAAAFEALRPGSGRLLGPIVSPMTGEWGIFVARKIQVPGRGEFAAVADVPLAMLTTPFSTVADMPGLKVRLVKPTGVVMATMPHREAVINASGGLQGLFSDGATGAVVRKLGDGGELAALAVTRRTLYPDIIVALSLTREAALATWFKERTRLLGVAAFVLFMVLCITAVLLVALRRHDELERERLLAQSMLEDAIEAMADGFVMWDADDRLMKFNRKYLELYSESAPYLKIGTTFTEIMRKGAEAGQYPQAGDDIEGFVTRMREWHQAGAGVIERLLPDGRWLLVTERRTANGGIVGIRTDITEFKRVLAELVERDKALLTQNELFDAAVNNMSHGLLMVDAEERLIVCNRRLSDLFHLGEPRDLQGRLLAEAFGCLGGPQEGGQAGCSLLLAQLRGFSAMQEAGSFVVAGLEERSLAVSVRPLQSGGFVAIIEDVTERKRNEDRIAYLAHHDPLTDLANRVQMRSRLDAELARVGIGGIETALLYLDLDRFKQVNDTLGHSIGDRLLQQVAERLRAAVRSTDLIARLGGDEFAISFTGRHARVRIERLANRLLDRLVEPYIIDGRPIQIGGSIGAAIASEPTIDADTLLKNADLALYAAKADGRGVLRMFDPAMAARLEARFTIERDLRTAIARGEFEVAYQPLFGLRDDRISSFEALLRWNHPERGRVSPVEFIPVAEETGIINELGAWCLERACADMTGMPDHVKVAVNVSPVQLKSHDFVETVTAALARSGVPASRLELEITESALIDDDDRILAHLHRLNEIGVRVVLDDFGTGYSSLNYLRRFPFQKVKIDKVFINEATERADCSDIIRSIVELAGRLGMSTTAEGIETPAQLELVRRLGCDEVQGFLLGKPGSAIAAVAALAVEVGAARAGQPAARDPDATIAA